MSKGEGCNLEALPKGWVKTPIKNIAETKSGGTPSTFNKGYWDGDIPWINSGVLKDKVVYKPSSHITQLAVDNSAAKLLPKNTVLIALTGATTGKVGLLNFESSTNQSVVGILPNFNYIPKFIFYYLVFSRNNILKMALGTAQPHINKRIVDDFECLLPPINEQHRIVTKIEELLTQLDAGIVSLKKVKAQLKRYRQAVLKAAFEGKLTREWREEHKLEIEPACVLFEKIKREYHRDEKEIAKRLPLDEAELFQVPDEWVWVQAQDVCENITNGYTPTADKLFEGLGEIPFIKVYNLTKTGSLNFTVKPTFISTITHEKELKRSAVYPQDVLMNIVGPPLGKVSLVPEEYDEWNINQAIVIYRTFPGYYRKLMLYALLSETIQKWLQKRGKTTAGQTNYTITMSRSLPIPLPPLNEQLLIVNEIERHYSQIDHLERLIETSLKQADTLRQSILKRAFEGKLVPQDPNDEPASILFERIIAKKAETSTIMNKGKRVRKTI